MVKIGDMCYAWASDNEILEKGECGGAVTTILKSLLELGEVDGVLAVSKGTDLYDAVPTLITDPNDVIKSAGSLHCGTLNMGKTVKKYLNGAKDIKIAVTVKPCDAMTLVELIKRGEIEEDNVLMIGINCGGTMPPVKAREMVDLFYEIDPDDVVKEEIAKGNLIIETAEGEKEISIDTLEDEGYGRRTNCRRCDVNIPSMTDMAFGNWGVIGPLAGKATFIEVFSDKGANALDKVLASGSLETQEPIPKGIEIRANIDNIMVKLAKKWQGIDFEGEGDLLSIFTKNLPQFEKCIKCFGCRESCPICYCSECTMEANGPEWIEKGILPPSPMFHLERMIHIADSCTNCGQCEEACPAEIPLSKIIHEINLKATDLSGYTRGFEKGMPPYSFTAKSGK
ncbi:MAG: Coenzyme F420 hydrogenase/dehydrogenase, beta subunit C-terminal domain [Methanobacteriaceae archaeon]